MPHVQFSFQKEGLRKAFSFKTCELVQLDEWGKHTKTVAKQCRGEEAWRKEKAAIKGGRDAKEKP